ncbi:Chromosome transmission fidelity protein 18 [Clonorchis sinensis]|uniref:Chromosome transmission fidelity protein 18 n=1 Tax=Clonorchis sinensis TaxID=79923 RepID=A0A419Q389_CLOSI|nr:Chromosome transmission fidelity protein 18 [Clonorchis sinensis]
MSDFGDVDLDQLLDIEREIYIEDAENVPPVLLDTEGNLPKRQLIDSDITLQPLLPKRPRITVDPVIDQLVDNPNSLICSQPLTDQRRNSSTLYKRIPLSGDYISVTFLNGTRYYLTIEEDESTVPACDFKFQPVGLVEEAERLLRLRQTAHYSNPEEQPREQVDTRVSELWTKRHAPGHYIDLISDETTNRTLLRWLKAWDPYVFGAEHVPAKTQSTTTASSAATPGGPFAASSRAWVDLERMAGEIDPRDGLPRYRVVLLAGCPGLGKTTLAHLLAQHAGYQVIEMNASDDRTVSVFKDQLTAIVSTSTSLNTTAPDGSGTGCYKPCCLILDEIDGAVPAAVELLATAARAVLPPVGAERRARGKRNTTPLVLRRPVICICNDLFSPAVRPLRAPGVPCLVIRLPNVDLGRLITRLETICQKEGLMVEKMLLTQLAEIAERDIRACLNALQFLRAHLGSEFGNKANRNLSTEDLCTLIGFGGGFKDVQRSLFDVWKAVFTIPSARLLASRIESRSRILSGSYPHHNVVSTQQQPKTRASYDSETTIAARIQHVCEVVDSAGDAPLIAMGIFENYLNSRMKDASLNVARQAANWFVFHDRLFTHILSRADYSLMRYITWLPAWIHLALATPTGLPSQLNVGTKSGGLRWPTAHTEANTTQTQCIAILDQLHANQWSLPSSSEKSGSADHSATSSFRFTPRRVFLLDVAPLAVSLLSLSSSSLRPLNSQLYSQQEKSTLKSIVEIMLSLGLDWSPQQNSETGEVEFQLEPTLDFITGFSGLSNGLRSIAHMTKQLIARELGVERLRRSQRVLQATTSQTSTTATLKPRVEDAKPSMQIQPEADSKSKTKPRKDFFGRPMADPAKARTPVVLPTKGDCTVEQRSLINQAVYYRFREGYSNAVRRPVTLRNFL